MGNNNSPKYETPRAVRLGDTATAKLDCLNGPTGTPDVCHSGFAVSPGNVCGTGSQVVN